MKIVSSAVLAVLCAGLVGCSSSGLPNPGNLPKMSDASKSADERFRQDGGDIAVRRIRVPKDFFKEQKVDKPISRSIASRPVEIKFASNDASVNDLFEVLDSAYDIQIGVDWSKSGNISSKASHQSSSGSGANQPTQVKTTSAPDGFLARRMPFISFKGTMGELFDTLRTSLGLIAYQEGSMVFLSDTEQYAITLPQNEDVMKSMSSTLKELGATDIVSSVDGGRIMYSCRPDVHDKIVGPFIRKASKNLATINIQVAVVNLALNDKSGQGFDWSSFGAILDQRADAVNAANSTTSSTGSTSGTSTSTTSTSTSSSSSASTILPTKILNQKGGVIDLTGGSLVLGSTNVGTLFGVKTVSSVSSTISFLSTFGNTNVSQHVDARTLSGKEVTFSSGDEIPYVKSIGTSTNTSSSSSSNGTSNTLGTAQTDKIKTGIEVKMTPRFESESELVTIDFGMKLSSLVEMVQLNAGNQLGTLTQPHTANQELNDILRLKAGQTVMIGGLQYDSMSYTGNEPTVFRDYFSNSQRSFGQRTQNVQRQALFVIMRPVVTVYEMED